MNKNDVSCRIDLNLPAIYCCMKMESRFGTNITIKET